MAMSVLFRSAAASLAIVCLSLLPPSTVMASNATPPLTEQEVLQLITKSNALRFSGEYAKALEAAKAAYAGAMDVFGPEDFRTASALHTLAYRHRSMGQYFEAVKYHEEALAMRERLLGPDHPDVAQSLSHLGDTYRVLGDFGRAAPLFNRALAIREAQLGPEHPDVARTLHVMGAMHVAIGDYEKALGLYERSLAIREKAFGPDHAETARALNYIAENYRIMGRWDEANATHRRSLAIREAVFGPEHPDVAVTLNNLAGLHRSLKQWDTAQALYERALAMRIKLLGPDHPNVSSSLNGLAKLHQRKKEYEEALTYYRRSVAIREKAFGKEHPKTAASYTNTALLLAIMGKDAEALEMLERTQRIQGKIADMIMGFASEAQKMEYLETIQRFLFRYLSFVAQRAEGAPEVVDQAAVNRALDVWLGRKGIVLESEKALQDALVTAASEEVQQKFRELAHARRELAMLSLAGPRRGAAPSGNTADGDDESGLDTATGNATGDVAGDGTDSAMEQFTKDVAVVEQRIISLKAELARLSKAFAQDQARQQADAATVAKVMPEDSVLVEYAYYEGFDFSKGKRRPHRYLAFVLPAIQADPAAAIIDLGDAAAIEADVQALRRGINAGDHATANEAAAKLEQAIWAPVADRIAAMGNATNVFLSPDGALNLIPFEILRSPDGEPLIERFLFQYLTAGRDLAGFAMAPDEEPGKPLLLGDPDYNLQARAAIETPEVDMEETAGAASPLRSAPLVTRAPDLRSLHFTALPGARQEVKDIAAILGQENVELKLGENATEAVLQWRTPPRILHMATHGFFLKDASPTTAESRAASIQSPGLSSSPLLRSGVALAGANAALEVPAATPVEADGESQGADVSGEAAAGPGGLAGGGGLLVAEKVLSLSLRGTDMVVLSACSTGLGEVQAGQGVYGLRRAFMQTGTRSLVMSMWDVPDRETRELMGAFYTALGGGMNRAEALRHAAKVQRRIVRRRFGVESVLHWGAFVFLGQP